MFLRRPFKCLETELHLNSACDEVHSVVVAYRTENVDKV